MNYTQVFSFYGGVAYVNTGSNISITNSLFNEITTLHSGGAVYFADKYISGPDASTGYFSGCTFFNMISYGFAAIINV